MELTKDFWIFAFLISICILILMIIILGTNIEEKKEQIKGFQKEVESKDLIIKAQQKHQEVVELFIEKELNYYKNCRCIECNISIVDIIN